MHLTGLMNGNLLVMADITHKAWSDARFFNEFYDDQEVYSVGLQLTQGPMKWRLGYGYADDPLKDTVADGVQIKTIGGVNEFWEVLIHLQCIHCLCHISKLWKHQ